MNTEDAKRWRRPVFGRGRLWVEAVWKRFESCRLAQVICGGRNETFHRG